MSSHVNHRILVIDDNRAIHDDLRKILCPANDGIDEAEAAFFGETVSAAPAPVFTIDSAYQGEEGVGTLSRALDDGRSYAMAFVDVRMPPGIDGIETAERLWRISPDLQVVICTAYSDYSWQEMITRLGHRDQLLVLKKPFATVEALQLACALCEKWKLTQEARDRLADTERTVEERTRELLEASSHLHIEIAERKETESHLRLRDSALQATANAIAIVARQGNVMWINAAFTKLTGYAAGDVVGQNLRMLKSEQHGPQFYQTMWKTILAGEAWHGELINRRKDGTLYPEEMTITPLRNNDGEITHFIAIKQDITDRKKTESDLAAARDAALAAARSKSQFLANMSHEIRTPMNGVIGMAGLLLDTPLNREQGEYVETIRHSGDLLLTIINDILDFSKIDAGKLVFETLDFDLREVVESTLELLAEKTQVRGLELLAQVEPDVCTHLRGDAGRLRQILTNLVNNAIKFTERGEVVVRVSQDSDTTTETILRFEVTDTGIGISPAAQEGLFEAFNQVDNSTTRKFGGTGLGLAICRQLVGMMQGELGVVSEVGKGSTFWFTSRFEKQAAVPPRNERPGFAGLRVLIVDDNATNRRILMAQLTSQRMRCALASGGSEALELLRRESSGADPFDLAILDMQMPEMDGLLLAEAIKSDPALAPTRLIMLSALGHNLDQERVRAMGIEAFLVKPVKQAPLFDCLAVVMNHRENSPAATTMPPRAHAGFPAPHPAGRILLAEDDRINQRVALLQLKKLGYHADVAADGNEVLAALEIIPYDLILMDCQMPELDGYETALRIRREQARPIHIIALTAHAMQGDREKCMEAGMDDFLTKPVRIADLEAALDRWQRTQSSRSNGGFPRQELIALH